MSGNIVRALNWDVGLEQRFIAINPIGDEVILYHTQHNDQSIESSDMVKVNCRTGFDNIQCSAYSLVDVGITAVGQSNGTISIFDITASTAANINNTSIAPTPPVVAGMGGGAGGTNNSSVLHLRPKQSRQCNTICFNNAGLIAGGFDKGRQDNSMQIWNIEHFSRTSNNDHIKRPTHSYIPNEAILSSVFYPDKVTNLLAGSYKFLREIDLRQETPVFQMSTKYTLGITIDNFRQHLFLTYSEDGSFLVWDRRKLTSNSSSKYKSLSLSANVVTESPVLLFNKLLSDTSRKNRSPCVRNSSIRKGEFAAVFNGDLIRRWNTGTVPAIRSKNGNTATSSTLTSSSSKHEHISQTLKQQSAQMYKPKEESLFVSLVLDTKTEYERVISFDYSPDIITNTSSHFVCMRQSGSVFRMLVKESIESVHFNSYNEFIISGPDGTLTKFLDTELQEDNSKKLANNGITSGNNGNHANNNINNPTGLNKYDLALLDKKREHVLESTIDDEDDENDGDRSSDLITNIRDKSSFQQKKNEKSNDEYDEDYSEEDYIPLNTYLGLSDVVSNDICYTIRKRASLGYGVDCEKNIKILEELEGTIDPHAYLINTWKWLLLAKKSLEKGTMISQGLDLGYQGVLGLWNGVEEINTQNRFNKEMGHITDQWYSHVVKSIVSSKGKKTAAINISSNSERKDQRKLCLIVSGWYLADDEFDEKLNALVAIGLYEKAAGWAVFHGDVQKAIEILGSSNKERLRIMSTAVAGYLAYKDSPVNSPWKDQCRKMASELDNPYLRAIFAFIADNDWWDVLDEHSLPLRERLGVALRFLSDKDLSVYLNRIAELVISKGELEGLILTGITPKGIALLQSYVDRTSDVQTAALITSFGCPRYFVDSRVDHWVHCYRDLLNSWSMFNVRAKFDVARTKLSKTYTGQITVKAAPKQVYLQCTRCNKNLSKARSNSSNGRGGATGGVGGPGVGGAPGTVNGGPSGNTSVMLKQFNKMNPHNHFQFQNNEDFKACPHCGAPLPRCSICLLSLGTPIPKDGTERTNDGTLSGKIENSFREWFSFCLSCNHGAHAYHAEEWFSKHYVCPVPDCNCRCNSK